MFKCEYFILMIIIHFCVGDKPCIPRRFDFTSVVCVCNATYCDEIDKIDTLPSGQFIAYQSTEGGLRFFKQQGVLMKKYKNSRRSDLNTILDYMNNGRLGETVLNIKRKKRYQKIYGFGGAMTDSVGINVDKLSADSQQNLLKSFFGDSGIEFNLLRLPIGSTDFSNRFYCYNMEPEHDTKLSNFTLAPEDLKYKIPFLKKIEEISTNDVYLMAASWTAPKWMKMQRKHYNILKKNYYQVYADYHIRYLQEMKKQGIKFWAISTGNEPSWAIIKNNLAVLGWLFNDQLQWIRDNFGPTIKNSEFSDLLIFVIDDARYYLPWAIEQFANDAEAKKFVDGIALHPYSDYSYPPSLVEDSHEIIPEAIILSTEWCIGIFPWNTEGDIIQLGSWTRGIQYFTLIMESLNHWYGGWIDWNLCLDINGGPSWEGNFKDASILVTLENDEFYKQPSFYALGHYSKFIPRGSVRIDVESIIGDIENIAFLRPDGGITVVLHNPFPNKRLVTVQETGKGMFQITVLPRSFVSIVYW